MYSLLICLLANDNLVLLPLRMPWRLLAPNPYNN